MLKLKAPDDPLNVINNIHDENSIRNPDSKVICFILWFYSIEPPFYVKVNKACINMEKENLAMLGPWARALH